MPNHFHRFVLSLTAGLLLSLPWQVNFTGLFIFFGFIPLLSLEDYYSREKTNKSRGLFWYSLLCFLVWNTASSWWISNVSFLGAFSAILLNSFLFTFVFYGFHLSKKLTDRTTGYFLLVTYWTAFEYLCLHAGISWPWLNLGNSLASQVTFIQWYEYSGTLGGTVWILTINILLFRIIQNYLSCRRAGISLILSASFIFLVPVIFSLFRYYSYEEERRAVRVAVIQPNIDPFHEKFGTLNARDQLGIILQEAATISKNSDYILAPETAIQGFNLENEPDTNWAVRTIRDFLKQYPKTEFITGAETARIFMSGESVTATSRRMAKDTWYDRYNSALQINQKNIQIYHKSKLVMGVEKMPLQKHFRFLEKYAMKLGGTYGSLGSQENREVFRSSGNKNKVAPVICYESVFGEFVGNFMQNGANILFIISNDGWFGNTAGHIHHLNYARLRAIETRRSVARCANTGISAFINQRGDILQSLGWWKRGKLTGTLNANNRQTFYTIYGDYPGLVSLFISITGIAFLVLKRYKIAPPRK